MAALIAGPTMNIRLCTRPPCTVQGATHGGLARVARMVAAFTVATACASTPTTTTGGSGSGGSGHGYVQMDTVPPACAGAAPSSCSADEYFLTSETACESLCSGEVFLLCESGTYSRYDCINPGPAWVAAAGSAGTGVGTAADAH